MVGNVSFLFLPPKATTKATQREQELAHANARSHVARLVHLRKRAQSDKNKFHSGTVSHLIQSDNASSSSSSTFSPPDVTSLNLCRPSAFLTVNPELNNSDTIRLFQYCTDVQWPRHDVRSEISRSNQISQQSWAQLARMVATDPSTAMFHAMMWEAAVCLSHDTLSPISSHGSIRQKQLAIRSLAAEIKQDDYQISTISMWAIVALTRLEPQKELFLTSLENSKSGFRPPIPNLFYLNVHGRQPWNRVHWTALLRIVERKGGLETIADSSLTVALQYMDICSSTMSLCRPRLLLSQAYRGVFQKYTRNGYFGHSHLATLYNYADAGISSVTESQVDHLRELELSQDVLELMFDLRVWSRVLQLYDQSCDGHDVPKMRLSLVALCRNLLQYRVLQCTILGFDEIGNTDPSARQSSRMAAPRICTLVQIAMLTFSVGVVFPISYILMWRRIVDRLRIELQAWTPHLSSLHDTSSIACFLWAGFLGGLAAGQINDSTSQEWFIRFLCRVVTSTTETSQANLPHHLILHRHDQQQRAIRIRSWSEIKTTYLDSLLWSESACSGSAQRLWTDVQQRLTTM